MGEKLNSELVRLADNQARLEGIVASVQDAIVTVNAAEKITLFNAAAEKMFGFTAELMLGEPLSRLIPVRFHATHSEHMQRFAATGVSQRAMVGHGTQWARRATGEEFPIEASISQVEVNGERFFTAIVRDVTERVQAEQALADSRAQLAGLVETAMDAIITVDEDQRITLYNSAAEQMFGYRAEIMLGQPLDMLIPERYRAGHREHIRSFGQTGVTSRSMGELSELCGLRANGQEFPIEAAISQIDIAGQRFYTVILRDLTSRRQSEEALRASQQQFQRIVETTHEGIWLIDPDNVTTYVNPRMAEMMGYSAEQMLGRPLADFVESQIYEFASRSIAKQRRDRSNVQLDFKFRKQDGTTLDVLLATSPMYDDSGSYLGSLAMCMDITDRKRAEAALLESQQFLEEAQETAKMGNWSLDMQTGQITWSRQSMKVFGVDPDSDSLAFTDAMLVVHPEDRAATQALSERAFSEGRAFSVEFRVQLADGELRWVRASGQPVRDESGRVTRFRGINHDITAQVQAEQERLKLEQQFLQAQKMEAIGTLAGGIAHDFNNILGAIQGYGELVLEHLEPGSQDYLDQQEVLQAAERAGQLVRQILTFSRKTQTKRVLVSLPLIVKEVSKLMRATLPTTIEVRQNLEVTEALVTADPIEVHQILVNLCTNAGYAMPEGGVLEVSLRSHYVDGDGTFGLHAAELVPGHYYMLGVTDTGAGIPPEIIGRIFEPFFTTKEQGEGTGLGLSTVHGTVKSLGGTVTVYSELGEGTTFHVYLPATEGRHSEDEKREVHRGSERILLVDDEPALAKLGKNVLEGLGYYVHAETDSVTALTIFQNAPDQFDLLITDETMPKLKGSELAKFVAELRPDLPVLLCTGYGQEVSGAVPSIKAVLHKPVSRAELSLAIREALAGSKLIGQG